MAYKPGLHLTQEAELFSDRTFAMTSIAKAWKGARHWAQEISVDGKWMRGKKGWWLKEENTWVTTEMMSPVLAQDIEDGTCQGHKGSMLGISTLNSTASQGKNPEWQVLCFSTSVKEYYLAPSVQQVNGGLWIWHKFHIWLSLSPPSPLQETSQSRGSLSTLLLSSSV